MSTNFSQVILNYLKNFFFTAFGAFLAALAIRVFLYPNELIDGGIVGVSLIFSRLFGDSYLSYFLMVFNLPFILVAYKVIRKTFVINMLIAVSLFSLFLFLLKNLPPFTGESIEVIVFGGVTLGAGSGFMIRNGACTDGTEIMGIILNKKMGFTVGQIVLVINIFIFAAYGYIFHDWHIALKSLLTYIVAFKMIDIVIAGLNEIKSVYIITANPHRIRDLVTHKLGLGLTIIPGIGGFSGEGRDILLVIVERLDLAELKELVLREDSNAFIAVQNLSEVAYGKKVTFFAKKRKKRHLSLKV